MFLQRITAPATEPVTLAEAKAHLRIDIADDDALITALISSARLHAEMLTARSFITTRWRLVMDGFPGHAIDVHKCPVVSLLSIQYLDMNGLLQTLPSTDYIADLASEPARITPVFGKIWPVSLPQIGAVTVLFDAGYGSAEAVPEGIKSWIKLRIGSLYEHREEVAIMNRGKIETLPFIDRMLDPYRVVTL